MNAAQWHLILVHIPVMGCPLTLLLLVCAHWRKEEFLFQLACGLLLGCALASGLAYWTGPHSMDLLTEHYDIGDVEKAYIEQHAVIARAAFLSMIVLAVIVLNALMQYLQEETPAKWHRIVIVIGVVILCYLLSWSAHLGGLIRHPEIREPTLWLFPELPS